VSPRERSKPTARQGEIVEFIRQYRHRNGFLPSVRDIGDRLGVNPATVHDHLKALERKGLIARKANLSRSLSVVGDGGPNHGPGLRTPDDSRGAGIPIIGRVAAGAPILAQQNIDDVVHLPEGWAPDGAFLLRVEGDSMRDAHILDRDLVLVRPQKSAADGEIVVALIDDEATIKRFYKSRKGIELRPENPSFDPIRISAAEADTFSIVGQVVGVFRL
jgi:repressor LexA